MRSSTRGRARRSRGATAMRPDCRPRAPGAGRRAAATSTQDAASRRRSSSAIARRVGHAQAATDRGRGASASRLRASRRSPAPRTSLATPSARRRSAQHEAVGHHEAQPAEVPSGQLLGRAGAGLRRSRTATRAVRRRGRRPAARPRASDRDRMDDPWPLHRIVGVRSSRSSLPLRCGAGLRVAGTDRRLPDPTSAGA